MKTHETAVYTPEVHKLVVLLPVFESGHRVDVNAAVKAGVRPSLRDADVRQWPTKRKLEHLFTVHVCHPTAYCHDSHGE